MPLLKISTNKSVDVAAKQVFLKIASKNLAELLQKSEKYVMTRFDAEGPMTFNGTDEATAYLEIKSIGLTSQQINLLTKAMAELVHQELDIDPARIYIEFSDAPANHWGWNKTTF
ncbi:phenylpyruvate tautomerase MIF-related protein [Thermophagus sp. OGC60D27]|uniref:phenylpyruvate tautomerase MIF-related protein n=1 Tax=Thermophagus sp. OGC60D27 TaxID=3458415 RepID=UPI004037FCE0